MAFAQIYSSSSSKKSASPRDALLEGRDALTEQAHAARPREALTEAPFPCTFYHCFYSETYNWSTVMPAELLPL